MSVEIFYCSYKPDLVWLLYSLQLLQKHLGGDYHTTIVLEPECRADVTNWGFQNVSYIFNQRRQADGYQHAMAVKMNADNFTDADWIAILDSDHLLMEPWPLDNAWWRGKALVRYRDWDSDPADKGLAAAQAIWRPPVERMLGLELARDYMLGPPFLFHRSMFSRLRARVAAQSGVSFTDYAWSDVPFSIKTFASHPYKLCDYEALGLYAVTFAPEQHTAVPYRDNPNPFRVFWSHGDWNAGLQHQLDDILKGAHPN